MCARAYGNSGQSTCFGDSGGPLIIEELDSYTLIGVVSFVASTEPVCMANQPMGYTRVTSYLNWINTHTGLTIHR